MSWHFINVVNFISNFSHLLENKFAHQPYGELKVFDPGSNNQVTGSQEIFYNQLDRYQQEQVLTDYLLQSTVHHAFKVQQLQVSRSILAFLKPNIKGSIFLCYCGSNSKI